MAASTVIHMTSSIRHQKHFFLKLNHRSPCRIYVPQTKTRKKRDTRLSTPKRSKKTAIFPKGRSVWPAAFAQRGRGNAGWAANKIRKQKDEDNVGQVEICIIISKFFVWMGKFFFLDGEISEHLDFTFWNLCDFFCYFFLSENLDFRGEHGGWTGFHVRFRSLFFQHWDFAEEKHLHQKYPPENSNWHHAMRTQR